MQGRNFLDELKTVISKSKNGSILETDQSQVVGLLADAWTALRGSGEGGMKPEKLINRVESLELEYPVLRFRIERHGGTVMGSSRAEIQCWEVNVEDQTACITGSTHRQLSSMDKPLDVKPIADRICKAIMTGRKHRNLKWLDDGRRCVRVVNIEDIIPTTNKMTTASRRKRFRGELGERLDAKGWHCVPFKNYVYAKK